LRLIVVHDVYILSIHIYLTTFLYVTNVATFLQSLVVLTYYGSSGRNTVVCIPGN